MSHGVVGASGVQVGITMNVHFDMETGDPDDSLALCVLATHPRVHLTGVTIHPGGADQVSMVKHILTLLGRSDVPVGSNGASSDKSRVSAFHQGFFGEAPPMEADCSATEALRRSSEQGSLLVTGAALTNVYKALLFADVPLFSEMVIQGGFAGDNVVPPEARIAKFDGRVTCPTYNLNGNPTASRYILETTRVRFASLVSKNVCHAAVAMPEDLEGIPSSHEGFELLRRAVDRFARRGRKALHDLVAVALALDPGAAQWVEGRPYRQKGEWGFEAEPGSPRRITIGLDFPRCLRVLSGS